MNALVIAGVLFLAPAQQSGLANPFYAMDTYTRPAFLSGEMTLDEQLDLLRELGYDGISWNEAPIEEIDALLRGLDARSLKLFAVYLGATVTAEGVLEPSPLLQPSMDRLRGGNTILWLHIGGKDGPPIASLAADHPIVARLRAIADAAQERDLTVAIYPHVGEWTERVRDAVQLARVVDRPNFGVTYNLCHSLATGDEPELDMVLADCVPFLKTATINGADTGVDRPDWSRLIQTLDRGTLDLRGVVQRLHDLGFQGPIGVQGYGLEGDPRDNLTRTRNAWRTIRDSIKPENAARN